MGYTEGENAFGEQDFALQQEWINMLKLRSQHLFGNLLPYEKIPSYVCSFLDMSQAEQLFVCGLLDRAQFAEMGIVSAAYYKECKQAICENYETHDQDEQVQSLSHPTVYEIQPRLRHRVFHNPIIDEYVEIVEKIKMAAIVYDLSSVNYEKRRFCLDDGQEIYDILIPQNELISDLRALEACLLVRNGCERVPEEYDTYLNGAVDYFCNMAVSDLSKVPENEWTKGAHKRGRVAANLFMGLFKGRGVVMEGRPENVMAGVLKRTAALLPFQEQFDDKWRGYLVEWFDELMAPYAESLIKRVQCPQKIVNASEQMPIKNDGREARE